MSARLRTPLLVMFLVVLAGSSLGQWSSLEDGRIYPQPNVLWASDEFGRSLDLHRSTLVIGAPKHDLQGYDAGAAWVFVRDASGWIQEAQLGDPQIDLSDHFGEAVAVHEDTVAVGAPFDEEGALLGCGAVYVYTRLGGAWSLQVRLLASDVGHGRRFGSALALDGDRLAVGALNAGMYSYAGAVYVFRRSGSTWVEEAKLVAAAGQVNDFLGASVALQNDLIVAGAPGADTSAQSAGAAHVFLQSGGVWREVTLLSPSDGTNHAAFGQSVALDGDTIAVGAPEQDMAKGAVYVFRRGAGGYALEAKLMDFGPQSFDRFGADVDLEDDRLVVGLPYSVTVGLRNGAVQLFVRSGRAWSGVLEMHGKVTRAFYNDYHGRAVALSGDLVASGAPAGETPPTGAPTGEAYAFRLVPPRR